MDPKDMMVVDANSEALGIPKSLLMENAGRCVAEKIFEKTKQCKVAIYAGNGGNGGDGFVAARYLIQRGYEVELYFLGTQPKIRSKETRHTWNNIKKLSLNNRFIQIFNITDSSQLKTTDAAVIVDAIMGTGMAGMVREPFAKAINVINESEGVVFAVDIPTGLDPLTGMVSDKVVEADFTVTFHKPKAGLLKADSKYIGDLTVCDIGIPLEAEIFTGSGDLLRLHKRSCGSHKGQNGRVLILGGSEQYSGAPALAALSSLRSGVDISVIACPEIVANPVRSYSPDLIVKSLSNDYVRFDDSGDILEMSESSDSVVIGCGIGRKEETGLVLNEMVEKIQKPIVIDADALKLVDKKILFDSGNNIVLTPHKSEFKSFFNVDITENLDERIQTVKSVASEFGCTVLLKGAIDVVSDGERLRLNSTGNPGMSVGGTGDVLAGLVGGLIATGHEVFEAASLGSYINGTAGDLAMEDYGYNFTASDLLNYIPKVFMHNI